METLIAKVSTFGGLNLQQRAITAPSVPSAQSSPPARKCPNLTAYEIYILVSIGKDRNNPKIKHIWNQQDSSWRRASTKSLASWKTENRTRQMPTSTLEEHRGHRRFPNLARQTVQVLNSLCPLPTLKPMQTNGQRIFKKTQKPNPQLQTPYPWLQTFSFTVENPKLFQILVLFFAARQKQINCVPKSSIASKIFNCKPTILIASQNL